MMYYNIFHYPNPTGFDLENNKINGGINFSKTYNVLIENESLCGELWYKNFLYNSFYTIGYVYDFTLVCSQLTHRLPNIYFTTST